MRTQCSEDGELCTEVLRLLHAHRQAGDFLETPALQLVTPLFTGDEILKAIGPERIGPYRVVGTLGRGGMGEVYHAERDDGQFEQRVAIKVIPYDHPELVRRFVDERRILARLQHPGIARLLDGGIAADGRPYFAMEIVVGEPIDQYCTRRVLSVAQTLALVIEVCDAVSYAHQHLVIHRDLKPSNILVTADGAVKLLDFGIAKLISGEVTEADRTRTGLYVLTPEFAAPEQIRGDSVSTATDVYSLGVLLYLLLTGKRPYTVAGKSPAEMERIIAGQEPPRPSTAAEPARRNDIRGDLDAIIMKALRKEPAQRYASVAELRDDLQRQRAGLPVRARPLSVGYRVRKFVARNRTVVAASVVTALALVTATAFSAGQMRNAQHQRDAALLDLKRQQAMAEIQTVLTSDSRTDDGRLLPADQRIALAERVVMKRFAGQPWLLLEMLASLSSRLYEFGDREAQRAMLNRALAIASTQDLPAQVALLECSRAYSLTFDDQFDSAAVIIARALKQLERAPRREPGIEATCAYAQGQLLTARDQPQAAVELLSRSLASIGAEDARLRQGLRFELANALRAAGRTREAAAYHREIVAELDSTGYTGTDILGNAYGWLSAALFELGELATNDSLTRGLIRNQAELERTYASGILNFYVGLINLRLGNLDTADVWLARAQRDTSEGAGGLIAYLPPALTQLRLEQGRSAEARRHLRRLPSGTPTRRTNAAWFSSWLLYLDGNQRAASRMLEDSLRAIQGNDAKPKHFMAMPYVFAAQWRLTAGDAGGADSLALLARSAASIDSIALDHSGWVGRAELVRARARLALGDRAGARASAERAVVALAHGFGPANAHTLAARLLRDSLPR